jgi:hypothetical protein
MRLRGLLPGFREEGEVIAFFGEAKLVRYLDGKCELRGGSEDDRSAAKEWISMFCHHVVIGMEEKLRP